MRKRAREREGIVEEEEDEKVKGKEKDRPEGKDRHINFFADVEQGVSEYKRTPESHASHWSQGQQKPLIGAHCYPVRMRSRG